MYPFYDHNPLLHLEAAEVSRENLIAAADETAQVMSTLRNMTSLVPGGACYTLMNMARNFIENARFNLNRPTGYISDEGCVKRYRLAATQIIEARAILKAVDCLTD